MEVTVNLNGIFAKINDKSELRETAQDIVTQIQTAYNARLAELMPKEIPVVIDAAPSTKGKKSAPTKTKKSTKNEFEGVPEANEQKATPTKKDKSAKDAAKTESNKPEKVEQVKIASLTKKQISAMKIRFEEYNEKCMLLIGETKPIKEDIKSGGWTKWYSRDERQGWLVNKTYAAKLAKALKIKIA